MDVYELINVFEKIEGYNAKVESNRIFNSVPQPPRHELSPLRLLETFEHLGKHKGFVDLNVDFTDLNIAFRLLYDRHISNVDVKGYVSLPDFRNRYFLVKDNGSLKIKNYSQVHLDEVGERIANERGIEFGLIDNIFNGHTHYFKGFDKEPSWKGTSELVSKVISCRDEYNSILEKLEERFRADDEEIIQEILSLRRQ